MITGELRSKVDKIWEIFWTGGITNPLSVIEQFTYLLFIKGLDEKQIDLERNTELLGIDVEKIFGDEEQNVRRHNFKQLNAADMYDAVSKIVFPFIKTMHSDKESAFSKYMDDAIYMIPTAIIIFTKTGDDDIATLKDELKALLNLDL
jgi:type I restriction enzyme M protein